MLAEPKGSTSPTSQPHQCAVFRRICMPLPWHTRFPEMLLKKSHLAQTNDLKPLTPNPATDQFPEPVPTCGPKNVFTIFFLWRNSPWLTTAPSLSRLRHTTLGRSPLDEWSARRAELHLTKHNNHDRQTSMPSAGFEPIIPAWERSQTLVLNRAATEIGYLFRYLLTLSGNSLVSMVTVVKVFPRLNKMHSLTSRIPPT